jgi:uncharacterized protein (DUF2062 family)
VLTPREAGEQGVLMASAEQLELKKALWLHVCVCVCVCMLQPGAGGGVTVLSAALGPAVRWLRAQRENRSRH